MPACRVVLALSVLAAACARPSSLIREIAPAEQCRGRVLLEFTNHHAEPVQVGWIPAPGAGTSATQVAPTWLGTVGKATELFAVTLPGSVIFRTANPAGLAAENHFVSHRLLCETPIR